MTPSTLAALLAARQAGHAMVLATRLPDGAQMLIPDPGVERQGAGDTIPPALAQAARQAVAADRSATVLIGNETFFLHVHNPRLRLIVVGAVHIAQALVPFAVGTGYAVTVVDPRRSFASDARFPNVDIRTDWPDEALDALRPDARTAIVTLTHDPKLDDPALDRALHSPAFYVGALGSRKTHAARLARLRALGHDDAALCRIHGPVGLDLGAVSAPEIALSIIAQLVATHRGGALAAPAALSPAA